MSNVRNFYLKIFFNILLVVLLGGLQLAAVQAWPYPFNYFNLIIVVLIFVLFLQGFKMAFFWSVGLGLMLDFYSFPASGINLASLIVAIAIVDFLFRNFFTDRSLYSLLTLVGAMYVIYQVNIFLGSYLLFFLTGASSMTSFSQQFFINQFYSLFLNSVAVILLYYLLNFLSKRYKPFFLK